jgi:hypothetical protein
MWKEKDQQGRNFSFLILGGRERGRGGQAYENLCDSLGIPGMVSLPGPDTPARLQPPFLAFPPPHHEANIQGKGKTIHVVFKGTDRPD